MEYIVILLVIYVIYWWHSMTSPNYPEFPYSWNPSDGPESEDELEDNFILLKYDYSCVIE